MSRSTVIDSAYPSCPFALSEVDLGVYCRRVSTVDEMPDSTDSCLRLLLHFTFLRGWIGASSVEETPRPRIMQTWWIGRSRQGLGRAGRVYRNSCQNRQAMNLQTFLPLALSEGIFGRPVWTRCRIPVRLDEDALYVSLSVDFGIMWLSMKGRGP